MFSISATCRSEIVIAYGALYDHSSKRPKITQFFNAGKAPPADGNAAPPKAGVPQTAAAVPAVPAVPAGGKAVPALPPPVAAPTPKATAATAIPKAKAATTAMAIPKAKAATETPKATTETPKAATATPKAATEPSGILQFVAEISDPPVKLMLDGNGVLALQSMSTENRKLKKLSVLMENVTGKLVRSAGGAVPPNSIRYSVQVNSTCVEHNTGEVTTLKDLCKKHSVNEIHGYQPFPTGIPQKLVETSDLWSLHQTIFCF